MGRLVNLYRVMRHESDAGDWVVVRRVTRVRNAGGSIISRWPSRQAARREAWRLNADVLKHEFQEIANGRD